MRNKYFEHRNLWLASSDRLFFDLCRIENYQERGSGGQKRNRKYSAVRLTHIETGLSAEASGFREQNLNKNEAARKLKILIALNISGPPLEGIRSLISLKSDEYSLWVAFVLDELCINECEPAPLAEKMGLSKSKLLKLIYRDKLLWNEVNALRISLNKSTFSL